MLTESVITSFEVDLNSIVLWVFTLNRLFAFVFFSIVEILYPFYYFVVVNNMFALFLIFVTIVDKIINLNL